MTGRNNLRLLVTAAFLVAMFALFAPADEKPNIIWECGQNVPNSAYWRKHGAELETMLPFDGVMLRIEYPVTKGGTMIFQDPGEGGPRNVTVTVTEEMVKPFVDDMRAAGLRTLNRNLVDIWPEALTPSHRPHNYFDDAMWKVVRDNIRMVARAARDSGCAGLVFDPEANGSYLNWSYKRNASATKVTKPYKEFVAKVRQRGREFGEALSEGFPDCTILFYYGHSLVARRLKDGIKKGQEMALEDVGDLYAPFLDGMLEGTSDGTIFVDGVEFSYSYATAEQFLEGRWLALHEALGVTSVPELFRKKVRCGFGIWTDNRYDGFGWYPYDIERNRFSPDRLQRSIHLALKYGDGYVWLWNEMTNWYVDGPDGKPHAPAVQQAKAYGVDRRYRKAVAEAKVWPGPDTRAPLPAEFTDDKTLGYVYGDELDGLLSQTKKVMDLPNEGWLFKADWKYVGTEEKWYLLGTPTDDWKPIRIGEFWERQGYGNLDGFAWYRREIEFKDVPADKQLYLHFGAVDESCHLWIDGKYVAAYDRGVPGWNRPFAIEVTGFITSGKHTLIIRAHDNRRMGGIWKPVSLIAQ